MHKYMATDFPGFVPGAAKLISWPLTLMALYLAKLISWPLTLMALYLAILISWPLTLMALYLAWLN